MWIFLEEVELWYLMEKDVVLPIDPKYLAVHTKKSIKEKQIIQDSMKDHLISYIIEKKMNKDLNDDLVSLY